ncbi:TonB-dependent receptor [Altererythrobacter sp. FM1]|uniref:TonB-dependent receptor plug domain-containing protein n=1 Tax=Tsuneonella flava TaxID=2055955 RepID=UPI000C80ABE6|nr:TonB-dependent receptor [Tsuneonella flava]ROT94222.1 TonB-dependent receptor [Altererythrobacter sp. FM1]
MSKYLFLLSCAAVASPALAAEDAYQADPTTITVTASGTGSNVVDTGQPVTVIGADEIDSIQGADIARVLERAPGVTISRNGAPGSVTSVWVRGASAEQLLVLVDGVRVSDPASPGGGFDFGNLLAGNIEKIDLLRGANSTIWGSDAMGGVLAVTTRAQRGLQASAEYGSNETAYLKATGGIGSDAYFLGGSASWYRTDGYSSARNGTEPDGFEQFAANGEARAYLSPSFELFVRGRYAKGDLDVDGFPAPSYTFADTNETQKTEQYSGAAGAVYDSGTLYLQGAWSFADTHRENYNPDFGSDPTYTIAGHLDRADVRGTWRAVGPLVVNFGGNGEWTRFADIGGKHESTNTWGAYTQIGIETPRYAAHVGVRHDEHERFGGETSFGADASFEIVHDLRLRASVGEGFKAPTLYQLLSDYGNVSLSPEQATSYDLGLAWRDRAAPTYAAVTLFRRDSKNLIDFISCSGVIGGICNNRPYGTYDNVGRARAQGVEIEFGLAPTDNLRTQIAYSYVEATDRATGNWLARRPQHALTTSLDWTTPLGLVIGGDVRLVGESFDNATNTKRLAPYAVGDIRASLPIANRFELFGRVENVTDADYETVSGYGTQGRAGYVGVRLKM